MYKKWTCESCSGEGWSTEGSPVAILSEAPGVFSLTPDRKKMAGETGSTAILQYKKLLGMVRSSIFILLFHFISSSLFFSDLRLSFGEYITTVRHSCSGSCGKSREKWWIRKIRPGGTEKGTEG